MRSRTRRQLKGGSSYMTRSTTRSVTRSLPQSIPFGSLPRSRIPYTNLEGIEQKIKDDKNYKNFRLSVLRRGLCVHYDYPKRNKDTYIIVLSDPKMSSSKPHHLLVIQVNRNTVTMAVKFMSIDKINKRFHGISLNDQSSTASIHPYNTIMDVLKQVFDDQVICQV